MKFTIIQQNLILFLIDFKNPIWYATVILDPDFEVLS